MVELDGVLMEELLDESDSVSFSAVILRSTDVGVKAKGVGEDVCWEWVCDGGVCLAGDEMELATTGVVMADEAAIVAGALFAVVFTGWFPICWLLDEEADELAPVVVAEVVVDEVVDEAELASGWLLRFCCCCCCCCSWRLR